jgi:hypothetical protein
MTFGATARLTFLCVPRRSATPFLSGALILGFLLWSWSWTRALAASDQSTADWSVHARGLGRLTVGMSLDDARQLAGIQLEQEGPPPEPADYCTYYRARLAGKEFHIRAMMNQVNRIELWSPGFRTRSGIAVGDSIERVKAVYGKKISVEPHHYLWDRGFVLMVLGPYEIEGLAYGVAFVASPVKGVTKVWAGRYDEIRQSEGCL